MKIKQQHNVNNNIMVYIDVAYNSIAIQIAYILLSLRQHHLPYIPNQNLEI